MTLFYWPFFTPSDRSKLVTMVAVRWSLFRRKNGLLIIFKIAVLATIPWDSYLVRNHIWTYPASAVTGMTLFSIPVEEVFFFGIQTYNTGLLYIILTKRLVLLTYLKGPNRIWARNLGALLLVAGILFGIGGFIAGGKYTYFGLILAWGCPFILIQW
jgi:15-cis-phytoene synthase/lycopene beta-cyclase